MKQAKLWGKLVGKCFLVLLPLWLVWSYIWMFPYGYMNGLAVQYINNKVLIQEAVDKRYDTLILGDSVSNASFEPEYMSERTLNLGQNSATPIEAYFVLCEYLQQHPAPKACFLAFAVHHMRGENGLYNGNFFSHRFSINQELEILQQAQLFEERSIIKKTAYESYKEWISYRLRLPNKYLHALVNASFNGRKKSNLDAIKQTLIHRGTYMSRSVKESTDYKDKPYKEYIVHPLYDAYYRKIFDLCTANGIQVHVVMTPICPNVRCTDRYQTELHNYHSNILKEYSNVTYLDRLDGFERKHLQDTHHVNIHGSLKFSKAIKRLYPEAFVDAARDAISRHTIDGMVDYLKMENYPSEILRRVEDTDFSAIIIRWAGKGGHDEDLLAAVNECYPSMKDQAKPLSVKDGKDVAIFYVNGMAKQSKTERSGKEYRLTDARMPTPFRLQIKSPTTAAVFLPWQKDPLKIEPKIAMDMTVVILNHYDKKVVAVKHFVNSHGCYVLIPE